MPRSIPITSINEAAELQHDVELLQLGKVDEAEPILRHVIRSNPKNADAHNLLGVILDQRSKSAEAEREYRAALRFNPNSISAMANLGVLLAHTQCEDEAVKLFDSVLRLSPNHPQAPRSTSDCCMHPVKTMDAPPSYLPRQIIYSRAGSIFCFYRLWGIKFCPDKPNGCRGIELGTFDHSD